MGAYFLSPSACTDWYHLLGKPGWGVCSGDSWGGPHPSEEHKLSHEV